MECFLYFSMSYVIVLDGNHVDIDVVIHVDIAHIPVVYSYIRSIRCSSKKPVCIYVRYDGPYFLSWRILICCDDVFHGAALKT